ncbi:MAG: SDR family oxidoreductase [Verrucomicrobiota bacterium]
MQLTLEGKTILMTGAIGAIAQEVILTLHRAGARLILTDKKPSQEAVPVLEGYGLKNFVYHPMDVTDPGQVEEVVQQAFAEQISIALGHAGGTDICPFSECSREKFDGIFAFNFTGQTYFARAVLREWTARNIPGHLLFTSSYVSKIPMAGISAYVAAKAALEMFAKNLALEYAPQRIRVNCISPGNVAAGSSKELYDVDPEYRAWVDRVSPLGIRNSAQGIANAFLYLCSQLGDELDGHVLQVDQGVGLPKLG